MKKHLILITLLLLAANAMAQLVGGTVRGKVNDEAGKPYPNAIVRFTDKDTGRKYDLKVNAKGEFIQVGMALGTYDATLLVDSKPVFVLHNITPDPSKDTVVDFDMAKERAAQGGTPAGPAGATTGAVPPPKGMSAEDIKKEQARIDAENAKIKDLNKMMVDAAAAKDAGNLDQAIALMTQATTQAPDKELLWIRLAEYENAAKKWEDAIPPHQKAIAIISAQPPEKQNKQTLAALHNNLGQALAKSGKTPEAIKEYELAAQTNPPGAAQYYFNEGAVLTNTGHADEANAAFDKAIASDPTYADAYYQKGVNLLGKATIGKDGKMNAPAGTQEALDKYLQLQPTGKYADAAKQLLASIGSEVQTGYKQTKKPK